MHAGGAVTAHDLEQLYALCDDVLIQQQQRPQRGAQLATPASGIGGSSQLSGMQLSQHSASWARGLEPQDASWHQDPAPSAQQVPQTVAEPQRAVLRPAPPNTFPAVQGGRNDAQPCSLPAPAAEPGPAPTGSAEVLPAAGAAAPAAGSRPPGWLAYPSPAELHALLGGLQERLHSEQALAASGVGSVAMAEQWGAMLQELLRQSMSVGEVKLLRLAAVPPSCSSGRVADAGRGWRIAGVVKLA